MMGRQKEPPNAEGLYKSCSCTQLKLTCYQTTNKSENTAVVYEIHVKNSNLRILQWWAAEID